MGDPRYTALRWLDKKIMILSLMLGPFRHVYDYEIKLQGVAANNSVR